MFRSFRISIAVCSLFTILVAAVLFRGTPHIISWDIFGYYLYLPQTIIHHDPGITDMAPVEEAVKTYNSTPTLYQIHRSADVPDSHVIMYPMGMALVYLPFFLIAHFFAWILGYPMDGYSAPYEWMMLIGTVVYIAAGVFLARRILPRFFDEKMTTGLLIALLAGTNYLFMALNMIGMSHIYLFVIYLGMFHFILRWHERFDRFSILAFAFLWALASLIRATEVVSILLFALWGVGSSYSLREKLNLFLRYKKQILTAVPVVFGVVFPQLLYWKIFAGSWFYVPYQNPGEGFEFLYPHTFEFLFSFRKGWLIYTPLMAFALIGMVMLRRRKPDAFVPFLVFFSLMIFVLSCWSNWWYAASFGSRPVLHYYGLLLVPMGFCFQRIRESSFTAKSTFAVFAGFFVFLNGFQTWQMHRGILSEYRMTWPYYKSVFLKTYVPDGAGELLLLDRMEATANGFPADLSLYHDGKAIWFNDFETKEEKYADHYSDTLFYSGKQGFILNEKDAHAPGPEIAFSQITDQEYAWIRVSMMVCPLSPLDRLEAIPYACFLNAKGKAYKWEAFPIRDTVAFPIGKWSEFTYEYLTPDVRTPNDKFSFSLWLAGEGSIAVDDFRAVAYIKK